jgi:hypothetical protein
VNNIELYKAIFDQLCPAGWEQDLWVRGCMTIEEQLKARESKWQKTCDVADKDTPKLAACPRCGSTPSYNDNTNEIHIFCRECFKNGVTISVSYWHINKKDAIAIAATRWNLFAGDINGRISFLTDQLAATLERAKALDKQVKEEREKKESLAKALKPFADIGNSIPSEGEFGITIIFSDYKNAAEVFAKYQEDYPSC